MKDLLNHLAKPEFFWIMLLAMPITAAFLYWSWRVKQKLVGQFVSARLLSTLIVGASAPRQKFRLVLFWLAIVAILFALAGPRWGASWEEAKQRGLDIIVAVDTSRSMLAKDVAPNRLERAKLAAYDLMREAKADRLGLIAFAGAAFLQCPLTLDDEAFRQGVDALTVGIIPQGGTALSEVIRTTIKAFEKGNDNHKVLLLFTDGEDHDEDVETLGAAKEADEAGLKIFTVGVGTAAGELLQAADGSFLKDEDGNAIKSHLNEDLLRKIATTTGGFYLPLVGANPMQVLYSQGLAPLPKTESTTKLTLVQPEHYHWFLGFAVLCLVTELLLPDAARAPKAKAKAAATAVRPGMQKAVALLCLLLLPSFARASGPDAYKKYLAGDYQGAFDEYSRLAGQKTNDYRLQYDAGTAAYRAKDLESAHKQLEAALNSPEIASDLATQENAYFNLGNTLYHLGEPESDPKKKQETWESSIADYSRALRLNTNDVDAKNNLAYVKKKLEEYQQQQQQQQKDQDKDKKDQKDQKDQQNKDQKNQDQKDQKDQQNQKDQKNQDKKDQKNQQDQKSGQKDQPDKKDQPKPGDKSDKKGDKSDQPKPGQEDKRSQEPPQSQQAGSAMATAMTMQEAKQMLDAQKDTEKTLVFTPENAPVKATQGKIKDW